MDSTKRHSRRVFIAIIGTLVTLIGVVLIPYPGPGWLIVFAGLAILATEFEFAQRFLDKLRGIYDGWAEWLKQQHIAIKIVVLAFTGLVVLLTAWLLNTFGLIDRLLGLNQDWLVSPFFK